MEDRPLGGLERGPDREQAEDLQELKKWPVGERIGQGAFGDAFLLADPKTKKKYVLKRIRMARQNEWQRTATRQEIKLGSMLQHPFIVRFVNSWIRDGHEVNLVYEFCSQGDLQTLLRKQKAKHTDELQLRRWLAELLLALHYLQSKQVLHRDLKSSNIFLTADNDVQIGDFGLATIRDVQDSSCHDQSIVGTPHFMSPEVLNRKKYDFKTDIWSLGCVIYELSALRSPFNAFNLNGLVSKICKSAVAPLPSQYSEGWNSVVKWMLKKSVNKRPSVEDLLASDELRGDVLWARERALQLTPGVVLPPLPTPTLLLRQLSGCGVGQDDDVLCADDGVHTPLQGQLLQPLEQYAVSNPKERGHGQIHCVDEAIYQPDEVVKTGQQGGQHNDNGSTPVSGRQWLLGVTRPQPATNGVSERADTAVIRAVPLADLEALTPESGVRSLAAAGNRGHIPAVAIPGLSILSKAEAVGAADRKGAAGKQQLEPSAAIAAEAVKGARPTAAAASTQPVRPVSASITAAAAPALAAEGSVASIAAAPVPLARATGVLGTAAGTAAGAPQPAVASAASTAEGGSGAGVAGATVRARVSRPRSAPREALDVSRPLTAAGGNRTRAAARQVAQSKPGAAMPAEAQAGMPQSNSGMGSPAEFVAPQPVATCDDSMDVDPPADPTSNSPCTATAAAAAPPAPVALGAAAGAAQSGAPAARAKLPVQRHTALSQARAGSIERRVAGASGATAAPQPRYRDATKAVAAAAAAAEVAQFTDTRGARTLVPAGAVLGGPSNKPANAAGSNGVPAAEASQPGPRPLAGLRAARRPVSSRVSPVRQAPRSNSAGGARAVVGTDGSRATLDAGRSRQPATLLAKPSLATTRGRVLMAGVVAPPSTNAAAAASDAMLQQEQQRTTDSAAAGGLSPACSASDVASEVQPSALDATPSAPDVTLAALAVLQQLRQPQLRRNSYISVSGQQLCEEFSLLSLPPPEEVVARSNSCSSLNPRRLAVSGRSCHSQSPTSAEAEVLPLASPSPARQVGHPAGRSRLQSAGAAIGGGDAGTDSSAEASVRQRNGGVTSASPTVSASDLSPAVALPATAYAAARVAAQQPQLFDNQLWNSSPNTRKAEQNAGRRVGGGTPDSPSQSSMSVEVTGPARERPTPSHEVVSSVAALPEAWAPSDGAADQSRSDLVTRATISAGGTSGEVCIRPRPGAAPAAPACDAAVVLQPSAATAELSFRGFKPAPGPGTFSQPVTAVTSTPAFPPRTLAPASQQPSSDTSLMSVSFASSDLLSVTRRLEMPSVSQGNSDDLAAVPGSLGKWMTPRAARDEAQSAVRGKAAPSPTAATSRSQAVVARILSPTTAGLSQRSQRRLTSESSGGGGEGAKETDGTKERLATLERVVALASRLHAMGRWHELGNVLSSMQPQAPGSEGGSAVGVAAGPDGNGAVVPGFLPSSNMVPCITSPNGGTRALNVGDKVIVGSRRGIATIRYWGPCHWAAGDYVGLELDRPEGKHQGEVDGICYFRCSPLHGIFVKSSMLKPANT